MDTGQVPEGSGPEKVPVQMRRSGSGMFRSRDGSGADTQVRFRKVPVQRLGEVPEGSGSDT